MGGPTGGGWGASVGLSSDPQVYNSSFFLVCVPASIAVLPDEYLKRVRPALYARGGPPPLQTSPYYSVERPENPPSRVFRNTHSVFRPPPIIMTPLFHKWSTLLTRPLYLVPRPSHSYTLALSSSLLVTLTLSLSLVYLCLPSFVRNEACRPLK